MNLRAIEKLGIVLTYVNKTLHAWFLRDIQNKTGQSKLQILNAGIGKNNQFISVYSAYSWKTAGCCWSAEAALQVVFDVTVAKACVCSGLARSLVVAVYAELLRKPSSAFLVVPAGQS